MGIVIAFALWGCGSVERDAATSDAGSGGSPALDAAPESAGGGGIKLPDGSDDCGKETPPHAYLDPNACPGLSAVKWADGISPGCDEAPASALDSLCTGSDPGPVFHFTQTDLCAAAAAAASGHASLAWSAPLQLSADCDGARLWQTPDDRLEIAFNGSAHVAAWVAAQGVPTDVLAEADVTPNGCVQRVRITHDCGRSEVLLAELPPEGGKVTFEGKTRAELAPSSVGPACANAPSALCGTFDWSGKSCSETVILPTCGARFAQCACGGVSLELAAGHESCGGRVRLAWYLDNDGYWRCL